LIEASTIVFRRSEISTPGATTSVGAASWTLSQIGSNVTVFWAFKHMPSCYHKKSAVSRTFLHIFKIYFQLVLFGKTK